MTQTVTGLFNSYKEAAAAVGRLEQAGIPHGDISIVASQSDDTYTGNGAAADQTSTGAGTGATAGTLVGGGVGLLAGLGLLAIPGVGPVVAAGWLVATLTGAGVGAATGGLIGSLVGAGVDKEHAHVYAEGVRRGGSLVTARVADDHVATADSILKSGNAVDAAERRASYEEEGWSGFDPAAPAFTTEDASRERQRYTTNTGSMPPRV